MFECAKEDGFEESQVVNSIESIKSDYANSNVEVGEQATNNRLLFLVPHSFHDSLMEKVLNEQIEKRSGEEEEAEPDANGPLIPKSSSVVDNFCPGRMLKERVLGQITNVQVLVCGNTSEERAI